MVSRMPVTASIGGFDSERRRERIASLSRSVLNTVNFNITLTGLFTSCCSMFLPGQGRRKSRCWKARMVWIEVALVVPIECLVSRCSDGGDKGIQLPDVVKSLYSSTEKRAKPEQQIAASFETNLENDS